jgi:hypothetical protein
MLVAHESLVIPLQTVLLEEMVLEFNPLKTKNQFTGSPTKKTPQETCRVLLFQKKRTFFGQKAKGEEKPEEELMGKRKSSPRLATTSSIRCCYYTPIEFTLYISINFFPDKN